MKALVLGAILIAVAVLTIIPAGLGWGEDVLAFLRGALPVLAIMSGLILLFIGFADIKDRTAAKKEKENTPRA